MGARTAFIEPGSPWENGYCESFNSKLRDELLNGEVFYSLAEARIVIESWRQHYNTQRPHSSLGYKPPAPPAVLWPGGAVSINHGREAHHALDLNRATQWGQATRPEAGPGTASAGTVTHASAQKHAALLYTCPLTYLPSNGACTLTSDRLWNESCLIRVYYLWRKRW